MKYARLSVLCAALTIAACGGGGDDVFGGDQQALPSFKIDSTNAVATARVSYEAAVDSGNLVSLGGAVGLSAGAPDGFAVATQLSDPSSIVQNIISMIPFGPDVYPCGPDPSNGTMKISGDIAVPGTLTVGDTFLIEYDQCDEGFGEVIDGVIDLTVADFAGELGNYSYLLAMDAVVTDLQVTTEADTVTGNGDATITLDTLLTPYIEAGVSGTQITMDSNTTSETLSNYSSNQTYDGNQDPAEYTLAAAGTLNSTQLTGAVRYATGPDFVGFGESYPQQGALTVTGEASAARLVAVDAENVRIDVDANGDGVFEESIEMLWSELVP